MGVRVLEIDIGSKIKGIRKEKGISIAELSKKSGVSAGLISQVERNAVNPSVATLWKISKSLNVSIGYFFDEENVEVREAGRDYVEKGKIEHKGTEYNGPVTMVDSELEKENQELKRKLIAAQERIIELMDSK